MSQAKTTAERKADERRRHKEAGRAEVRGIYAPTADHAAIKEAAAKIARDRESIAACPYCNKTDAAWSEADLKRGKRGLRPGPGVEYHCMSAFYCAS